MQKRIEGINLVMTQLKYQEFPCFIIFKQAPPCFFMQIKTCLAMLLLHREHTYVQRKHNVKIPDKSEMEQLVFSFIEKLNLLNGCLVNK